jgi:iron complex outermembrane receptor protein
MKMKTLVGSLALLGLATHVFAQQAPEQRVTITGSSIKRIASEGALPVQVISRAEIERTGVSSTEALIANLNINGTGLDNLASNADVVAGAQRANNGASSANLRSQGPSATLVLLNGRRLAAHGLTGTAVDLNSIPFAAIERVEILKDGASAIYGTDAIGGVINFILRQNVEGATVAASTDITVDGGGDIHRASVTAGYGNLETQRFNLMAVLSVSEAKALRGAERDFVNTFQPNRGLSVDTRGTPFGTIFPIGIGPNTPSGTLLGNNAAGSPFLPNSTTVRASGGVNVLDLPGGPGCGVIDGQGPYDERLWNAPTAALACAWDTGRAAVLQQPVESFNLVTRGVLRLGNHQLVVEAVGAKVDSAKRFSNIQLIPNTTGNNAAYPRNANSQATYDEIFNRLVAVFPSLQSRSGLPIAFRWRCIECGPREIETSTRTGRIFVGADGPLMGGWDYRTGASSSYSKSQSTLGGGYYYRGTAGNGTIIGPGLVTALNTGLLNPFLFPGQSQSAAGLAELERGSARGTTLYGGKYTVDQVDFSATGPLLKFGGGEVMAAAGVDVRKEKFEFNGDARAASARPVILGAPFDDANAVSGVSRDIKAVYAELLIPFGKQFEVTLAARRDDYTIFGATTNPKVAFRWQPSKQVLLRGSYNEGFRVPNFNQIYNGIQDSVYFGGDVSDPATCPLRDSQNTPLVDPSTPGCAAFGGNVRNRGSTDLRPETSKQWGLGVVFEPIDDLSIGIDWWQINRIDTISLPSVLTLFRNPQTFSKLFLRDANNVLQVIDQPFVNNGETQTAGIDVSVRAGTRVQAARVVFGADISYLLQKKSRLVTGQPFGPSELGVFSFADDLGLRWKHTAFATATIGDWSGTVTQVYRSGYAQQVLPGVRANRISPTDFNPKVDAYEIFHLMFSYKGIKGLTINAGVKNIFNEHPPLSNSYDSSGGSGSSWEPRVADPRGRSWVLGVEYKF